KAPSRVRHYDRVHEAKEDHDEYRRGVLLEPYFMRGKDVEARLHHCREDAEFAETISLDAGTYQSITGYPLFEQELRFWQESVCEKEPDRLVMALGTSLAAVDHLHTVDFSPKKDKPHLLMVGRAELELARNDVQGIKLPPRDACINLMLQSLRLSPNEVKVAVVDPNSRLIELPAISKAKTRCPIYCTDGKDCKATIKEWIEQASAKNGIGGKEDQKPFVLFVIDAQANWLFNGESQNEMKSAPKVTGGFADMFNSMTANPKAPAAPAFNPIVENGKDEREKWDDLVLRGLTEGHRNKAYLVMVTDSPGMVEENFYKFRSFSLLSSFRVIHFNYSGDGISKLRRTFDNRSETNGSLFESGEYENLLTNRFLPFEPFEIEPFSKEME
ncbi:MAG: hypothetical protein IJS15_16880, partial [Victivallales bacterium]|nr:hypothetical protein [Victivallales bacterium]